MIKSIKNKEEIIAFINDIADDECYSTPLYDKDKAADIIEKDDCFCIGSYKNGKIRGAFCFLVIKEEKYLESMFLYSRNESSYREMLTYLQDNYPSYEAWFVLNPGNKILRNLLTEKGAYFYTEQSYMEFTGDEPADPEGVIPYDEKYREAYIALHSDDAYWSGEKMLEAQDRFKIFLYIKDDDLAGYIDVSTGSGVNEVFDVLVSSEYRRQGIGGLLVDKAVREHGGDKLILTVDIDNEPALGLYRKKGFKEIPRNSVLTAKYRVW